VRNQTPELCIAAVQKNGSALAYIINQTLEICLAAVTNTREAFCFVAPQYRTQVRDYLLNSIELTTLPESVNVSKLEDPVTFEPPVKGDIYGFIVRDEKWHLGISHALAKKFVAEGFRFTSIHHVFIPILNKLYPMQDIKWVRL
jgi:hypothetical protein